MKIVVLTGAGISAESGIRTFRAADGLWEGHSVEDVATPEGYAANPRLVQNFYNERRAQLNSDSVSPNAAHDALVALENYASEFLLVTQNVDNLHERAGSKQLLHMHGQLQQVCCTRCGASWQELDDISVHTVCQHCSAKGTVRPDIVWFGEIPKYMEEISLALSQCDMFISIGTSGHVYPAAGFVQIASSYGAQTLELNLEPSQTNTQFDQHVYGSASKIVPKFVGELIAHKL
ncbi:Sir2 family NAD+-dependent deacetylase [Echinimonas agarilytica]|uniref:NAD-dependent protein deacylase n=1 Tax=Echinimonas agarilytica TaxID=1215918 RepID=A0AA41W8U8_9GAMM|nr:Sir2 family NAD+-dependent deacetylase [Echinimonas agarilytica]MCM2681199.1 NAD-dependent protein deacylase [Echinimonas agarilytica]